VVFLMMALFAVGWFTTMRLFWDIYRSGIRGSDFSSYYTAGLLIRQGRVEDLYAVAEGDSILGDATSGPWAEEGRAAGVPRQHYYIYPPAFALLFVPMTFAGFESALNLWLLLDFVLLALFAALYVRARGEPLTWPEGAFMALTCLFEFLPVIWAMAIGQTSFIVLVLLTGTLLAWRRGWDGRAGVLLGLAVALKLTPALLSVFFWWRGRRKIAVISGSVFVAAQLLSIALMGWETHRRFFLEIVPSMSGGTAYFLNQSFGALFNRLITDADVRQVVLVNEPLSRLLAAVAFLVVAAISAPLLRGGRRGVALSDELQFGCVLLLTLFASPISWIHHYLIALPALYAVVGNLGRREGPSPALVVVAGVAFLLIARKPHPDLFMEGFMRLFNSGALAGALVLWALTLLALSRGPAEERA
jgi:hypothetical protein